MGYLSVTFGGVHLRRSKATVSSVIATLAALRRHAVLLRALFPWLWLFWSMDTRPRPVSFGLNVRYRSESSVTSPIASAGWSFTRLASVKLPGAQARHCSDVCSRLKGGIHGY